MNNDDITVVTKYDMSALKMGKRKRYIKCSSECPRNALGNNPEIEELELLRFYVTPINTCTLIRIWRAVHKTD